MENYEDMYKKICRVCLKLIGSQKMEPLTDDNDPTGLSCFGKAIPVFAHVSYKKDDKFPPNVCQKCIFLLKQVIRFKFTCESSDKWLRSVMENSVQNNLSLNEFQENICLYIMHRHYFPINKVINVNKKRKKCLFPKENVLKTVHDCQASVSLENPVTNNKKCESSTNNLLQESDSDFIHFEDDLNTNIEEKPSKSKHKCNKKQNIDNNNLIDNMKRLIEKKEIKKRGRQIVSRKKDIPCEICNKILANKYTYDQHMQRHNICKLVCDKCGKGFPVLSELHIHQISRHGVGPYFKCDQCSYKAPTRLKLKEHIRLHTGERPFTCEKCGLTFRRQAIWRNHQVLHTEKQFQCKLCPQKFYRHSQLLAHMNNIHERKYVFICSVCDVTYAKTESVRLHMISKHGIKRELQGKIKKVDKILHCFRNK